MRAHRKCDHLRPLCANRRKVRCAKCRMFILRVQDAWAVTRPRPRSGQLAAMVTSSYIKSLVIRNCTSALPAIHRILLMQCYIFALDNLMINDFNEIYRIYFYHENLFTRNNIFKVHLTYIYTRFNLNSFIYNSFLFLMYFITFVAKHIQKTTHGNYRQQLINKLHKIDYYLIAEALILVIYNKPAVLPSVDIDIPAGRQLFFHLWIMIYLLEGSCSSICR